MPCSFPWSHYIQCCLAQWLHDDVKANPEHHILLAYNFVDHSVTYTQFAAQVCCRINVCPLSVQVHPGLFAAGAPWLTGPAYKDTLAHYANTAVPCTYVRDKGEGQVTIDKQGYPRVHYQISPFDQKSLFKVIICFLILTAVLVLRNFGITQLCELQLAAKHVRQPLRSLFTIMQHLEMPSQLQLAAKHEVSL